MAKVKMISDKNKRLRVVYGKRHRDETVKLFWQYVHFTDEAHVDPDQVHSKHILREEGTRYEAKNIQSMPDVKGVKLNFATSISWHHKGELHFYNDEHGPPVVTKNPPNHANQSIRL